MAKKEVARRLRTNEEVQASVDEQLQAAKTVEDVLGIGKLYNADDVLNEPLMISGFELNDGDFGEYALVYAFRVGADGKPGEAITVSCGGGYVLPALKRIREIDGLPFIAQFTRKETNQGFRVYRLEAISS